MEVHKMIIYGKGLKQKIIVKNLECLLRKIKRLALKNKILNIPKIQLMRNSKIIYKSNHR